MDDLISRQETSGCEYWDSESNLCALYRPSAERYGRWIPDFGGKFKGGAYWFRCSMCGRIVPNVRNGGWNYCPHCGAKMEGAEE